MGPPQATRQRVAEFLASFKVAMDLRGFKMKPREKNLQGLVDLGLTTNQAKGIIAGLTPDNYVAGPKPDDTDPSKDVWEFGASIGGRDVYIKLRLTQDLQRQSVVWAFVWSFHPAEFPMKYPLRGGGV